MDPQEYFELTYLLLQREISLSDSKLRCNFFFKIDELFEIICMSKFFAFLCFLSKLNLFGFQTPENVTSDFLSFLRAD